VATKIALLRAVNLGGETKVSMADLRKLLAELGLGNPRTLLQSGNAVFEGGQGGDDELEKVLESETTRSLALRTDFFVRDLVEWSSMIANNPFLAEATTDPSHLLVVCLRAQPGERSVRTLDALAGPERAGTWGRHLYLTYPKGIGRSRLTMSVIERTLGTRGTARNWNTVLKLAALAQG
jgi:uncharacterized protein (DUF1697 family)